MLREFVLPALLVSGAAWLALELARHAPPRLKFWIAMLGLAAWVVPWPLVPRPLVPSPLVSWPSLLASPGLRWLGDGAARASAAPDAALPLVPVDAPAMLPGFAWLAVLAPGVLWFAIEWVRHRRALRAWRRESRDGAELLRLLPLGLARRPPRIRRISGSMQAAATGVLRPTIWIGDRLDGEALRAALIHECCHARRGDPCWLMLIRLIKRAYAFNPVVAVLARHADLWLEAACDEDCARLLGRPGYRRILARLILSGQERPHAAAALLSTKKQNLRRLELLQARWRIGRHECGALALCAIAAFCGAAIAASPYDPRIGRWAEIGEAAPDGEPVLSSFEDLGGGFVRFRSDVMADGTAQWSADYRCDGRLYAVLGRFGEASEWRLSCRRLGPLTVDVTLTAADGSGRQRRMIDRISADGETYTSTVISRDADGTDAAAVTRELWRLH